MKTAKKQTLFAALPAVLAAVPARAAAVGEGATPGGFIVLLLVMGIALVLAAVTGYLLNLIAGLGGSSRSGASIGRAAGPEKFVPYLEDLDGAQLDALESIHAPTPLPTLPIHDHAKEQLV